MAVCTRCGKHYGSPNDWSHAPCGSCQGSSSGSSGSSGKSTAEQLAARRAEQKERWKEHQRWYASLSPAQRRWYDIIMNIITAIVYIGIIGGVVYLIHTRTDFFTNTGDRITGFFGKETAAQATAINKLRKAKSATFLETGVEITADEFAAKKTDIDNVIKSGASYRMKGLFQHNVAMQNWFETHVEMSYNATSDVYRFVVKAKRENGSNPRKNPRLANYYVPDGIYYIVRENGKTYLLSSNLK